MNEKENANEKKGHEKEKQRARTRNRTRTRTSKNKSSSKTEDLKYRTSEGMKVFWTRQSPRDKKDLRSRMIYYKSLENHLNVDKIKMS